MPRQPRSDLRLLVGRVVVKNDVDCLVFRQFRFDCVEKANELLMSAALHVAPDDGSVENVEGGKQGGRAVAFIVMGHRAGAPRLERQARLGPVERLDLAFLVDRQDNGAGRRRDIKADDIVKFLGERLFAGKLEAAPAMRRQPVFMPDLDDRRAGNPNRLRHGPHGSMRRFLPRRPQCQRNDPLHPFVAHRSRARRPALVT